MKKTTIGGDRLGSGGKMTTELRNYDRSTHDLSYIWRSTMSAGTLVPFMCEVALPGDTFDINLDCDIKTHPTLGPLFGSYKVQLDVFEAPIRLYIRSLHDNRLKLGLNMQNVKFPKYRLQIPAYDAAVKKLDNTQINPSCLLAYLGVRGVGFNGTVAPVSRDFNAIPLLAYWEIYKNYYANKQEEIGAVIHTPVPAIAAAPGQIELDGNVFGAAMPGNAKQGSSFNVDHTGDPNPPANQIIMETSLGNLSLEEVGIFLADTGGSNAIYQFNAEKYGSLIFYGWHMITSKELNNTQPEVTTFPLINIETVRLEIMAQSTLSPYLISQTGGSGGNIPPYSYIVGRNADNINYALSSQEGLAIKTYQSDIFNNWLQTEWIDGAGGITEITSIDTSGGSFSIDTLNLSKKVYDMLNRIAISGGTYDDWIGAVYQDLKYFRATTPIYHGGLSKELIFQEVVSNSSSTQPDLPNQPLGTLAGKGAMAKKHKGGYVTIKIQEPSYLIGIISLTPRIDYSQGNRWDVHLNTMDDLHKPALDEIGFQELITEQMAFWDTQILGGVWTQKSAGKQPAWINYMTNFNRVYGNFAIEENEMFMTLNRRYEQDYLIAPPNSQIKDLTTYIDPSKYNQIFAQTSLDSQNFWAQIAVDITARRLMSAKVIPNL